MPTNKILQTIGTSFVWANSTYSPGANTTLGTYSATYDVDAASLGSGAARQSIKADLGASFADGFSIDATTEVSVDPAAGGSLDLYWSGSESATAAVGNMGGCSGADGAYTGYAGHTLAESLRHLQFIGSLLLGVQNDADGVVIGHVHSPGDPHGLFRPLHRYGILVIVNSASVSLHSDSVEMAVRFTPIVLDIQAAA